MIVMQKWEIETQMVDVTYEQISLIQIKNKNLFKICLHFIKKGSREEKREREKRERVWVKVYKMLFSYQK